MSFQIEGSRVYGNHLMHLLQQAIIYNFIISVEICCVMHYEVEKFLLQVVKTRSHKAKLFVFL